MKNLGFSAIVFGGIAAATLGFAGRAAADTGIGASGVISASGPTPPWYATPSTPAHHLRQPAATIVPWADAVNDNDADSQPWSSVSG